MFEQQFRREGGDELVHEAGIFGEELGGLLLDQRLKVLRPRVRNPVPHFRLAPGGWRCEGNAVKVWKGGMERGGREEVDKGRDMTEDCLSGDARSSVECRVY